MVGIDVGGTKVLARVAPAERPTEVLAEVLRPTPTGATALLDAIEEATRHVVALVHPDARPAAVGVGVPGLVDDRGVLHFAPHLPGVTGLAVRDQLEGRLGVPVGVANDATLTALAEARVGAGAGHSEVLVVAFGTGIGAGLVSHGRIVGGAHGFAGEPGHMLVDPTGPPCACGGRGCWETYASGSGLAAMAARALAEGRGAALLELAGGEPAKVRGEHVSEAARAGDADALALVEELGWWIAVGLANLVTLLDPRVVVVGGGLLRMLDLLAEPVQAAYEGRVFGAGHRPATPILPAALGDSAGSVGAWLRGADELAARGGTPDLPATGF